jgi:hypothetical protein
MAANIIGTAISWGAPSGANAATTSGIVQQVSLDPSSASLEVPNEDGDIVSVVKHGFKKGLSIEVICLADSAPPEVGDEIDLSSVTALGLGTGTTVVDSATVNWANSGAKKITVKATHYPEIS